jgi:hypothetical protein
MDLYRKQYYQKNKEKILKRAKEWHKDNPEQVKHQHQDYYQKNKEDHNQRTETWRKNNKSYFTEYKRKQKKDPIKGPLLKLHESVSVGIRNSLKKIGYSKSKPSLKILGLKNWDLFREHIEKQWEDGMNWENYGNKKGCWNIDHIIPVDSVSSIEDLIKINHYTNFFLGIFFT